MRKSKPDNVYFNEIVLDAFCISPLKDLPDNVHATLTGFLTAKFKLQLFQAHSGIEKNSIKNLYFEIFGENLK